LQVQRLEGLVGHAVLSRSKGGAVELTPKGKFLIEHSRELLALNDKILTSLRGPPTHDAVRLGVPEAFSQLYMPSVLRGFAKAYPTVSVEISHGMSCEQVPRLRNGDLDLMICEGGVEPRQWPAVELWRAPLRWITSEQYAKHLEDPLPLSVGPGNCPWRPPWLDECVWRGAALRALERAGRRYIIVSTSQTMEAQHSAVLAGLAVTVSTTIGLPSGLRPVRVDEGLPDLPETSALLLKAHEPRQPVTDALAAHITEIVGATMRAADINNAGDVTSRGP
jgi:DNA-binding transcriptional LysR family regulator